MHAPPLQTPVSSRPEGAVRAGRRQLADDVSVSGCEAPALRRRCEPRFGRDFAGVRVHADERAAAAGRDHRIMPANAPSEHEADRAADAVMAGQRATNLGVHATLPAGAVSRQPAAANPIHCTAGVNGAPADPASTLDMDRMFAMLAVTLAQSDLTSLHLEAVLPGVGAGGGFTMPTGRAAQAYTARFGLPPASGRRFRNRLSGATFASQAEALVEESRSLSTRYDRISATLTDSSFNFRCMPNPTPANSCGADCSTRDAFGCPSQIMLCPSYWPLSPRARSQLLIHEVAHSIFSISHDHGFTHADCYAAFAADAQGQASTSWPACTP